MELVLFALIKWLSMNMDFVSKIIERKKMKKKLKLLKILIIIIKIKRIIVLSNRNHLCNLTLPFLSKKSRKKAKILQSLQLFKQNHYLKLQNNKKLLPQETLMILKILLLWSRTRILQLSHQTMPKLPLI